MAGSIYLDGGQAEFGTGIAIGDGIGMCRPYVLVIHKVIGRALERSTAFAVRRRLRNIMTERVDHILAEDVRFGYFVLSSRPTGGRLEARRRTLRVLEVLGDTDCLPESSNTVQRRNLDRVLNNLFSVGLGEEPP